ncbi:MAG: DUF1178 family protein [Alphaproteobacteria bacterium]
MIHYALRCANGHEFDGWFQGSRGFEREARAKRLECPLCESHEVERAIMAPSVSRSSSHTTDRAIEQTTEQNADVAPATNNRESDARAAGGSTVRRQIHLNKEAQTGLTMLRRMRRLIEEHCEHVGPRFAEEARKIHEGESDVRGIYGESTPEELRELDEEDIKYESIPWVNKDDT